MEFKWIVLVISIWLLLSALCGVAEGELLGGGIDPETGEAIHTSVLNTLMTNSIISASFWGAAFNMAKFNYPAVFSGSWEFLRWLFLVPLSTAFIIMFGGWIAAHIPVIGRGT